MELDVVAALSAWGRRDVNWAMCCKNLLISATDFGFGRGQCTDFPAQILHQRLILPSIICDAIPPEGIRGKGSKNTLIQQCCCCDSPSQPY